MKKVRFEKKLGLRKETIVGLNSETMEDVKGGARPAYTDIGGCTTIGSGCSNYQTFNYTCHPSSSTVF